MINNDTLKRQTLLDLIDLKEQKQYKGKINGKEYLIVCLVTKNNKQFAMIAGGYLLEITNEQFNYFNLELEKHLKKHIFRK